MARDKKLFLLDAMALIYRAHFALIRNPIRNSKGVNTSAVYGFTNTLLEVLEKERPSHIAVVFDPPVPTFRHEEFEAYKSQRQEMPEDIGAAIPIVKKLLKAFRIPCMEKNGFEADDVIGTLAKQAPAHGFEVFMMTPDKDYGQLVEEHIYMYKPSYMQNPREILDEKAILKKWGIARVDQVVDILGLMGDSSDNIPGVPGIGPKTAAKLIAEFETIENLLDNTDKLKGKVKEQIEMNKEQALLSKRLATIITNVPVEFDEKDLELEKPDEEALAVLFAELEFRTISKRVLGQEFRIKDVKTSAQPDLFNQEGGPVKEAGPLQTFKDKECSYELVNTDVKMQALAAMLKKTESFCFDTETSGLDPLQSEIVGFSFSIKPGHAYYIPTQADEDETKRILSFFKDVFEDSAIGKTGQNIKFDILVLKQYGIHVRGKLFDTVLAHYLLEPDLRHNMDMLSQTYLGYSPISIETLIGKRGKQQKSMRDLIPEDIVDYACEDADVTLQLQRVFEPLLSEMKVDKLFYEVENPLIYVLAEMENKGVRVDKGALNEYSKELNTDLVRLEKEIFELAGMQFNISSPKQLGEVLFDHLKLDPKAKRTSKTKQYSTSEDVLARLAANHEVAAKLLDFRSIQKLKSTYVDALPLMINPKTGRVHTSYNQAVAATGRLSSTNPNLQNIPIRTEKGREIRKAFIPADDDHTILSADYSQIELRLVAEISNDTGMLEAFKEGIDIHTATSAKIFGVSLAEVTGEMRRKAKMVNFGIIYGISAFGLAQRLNIARSEASEIIRQYFAQYPNIKKYMDDRITMARKHGYVETLMGRRRYLRDINSSNHTVRGYAERNAINAPIQGTAADMIKVAMVNIHEAFLRENIRSHMILQVHDELIFDALKTEVEQVKRIVEDKMRNALKLEVPIVVEIGAGENWLLAH
ncbi:MAG: DNA polymerase I [Bacteroidia bacterium]